MKSPLILPLHLAALWLLFLLLVSIATMVAAWVPHAGDAPIDSAREVLERSPTYVDRCIPIALFPAVFLTSLRAARNPVSRPFTLLLPFLAAFCILYFAPMGLALLGTGTELTPVPPSGFIRAGALTEVDAGVLVASRAEEGSAALEGLVLLRPSPAESRLLYVARGEPEVEGEDVVVRLEGEGASEAGGKLRVASESIWARSAAPGESTAGLIADIDFLNQELASAASSSQMDAILLCVALAAFLCFSGVLLRMTRWPLLGFVFLGLLWRYSLLGIRFSAEYLRPALGRVLPAESAGAFLPRDLPAFLLLAVAVLCLAIDLLFVSFDFWKREIDA